MNAFNCFFEFSERKVQEDVKINGTRSLAEAVRGEEERECMEQVFLCRAVSSTADLSRQFAVSGKSLIVN